MFFTPICISSLSNSTNETLGSVYTYKASVFVLTKPKGKPPNPAVLSLEIYDLLVAKTAHIFQFPWQCSQVNSFIAESEKQWKGHLVT